MAYTPTKAKSTGASGKYPTYQRGSSTRGRATPTPKYYNPETKQLSTSAGTIINAPTEVLRNEQGQPILNAQGETTTIQEVREKEISQRAKEGERISEKQLQYIKQQQANQPREIAVDYEAVNKANKSFEAAGIKNAADFFAAVKSGELTSTKDAEGNNQYNITRTTITTTTSGEQLTEAQAAEVNKKYFGTSDNYQEQLITSQKKLNNAWLDFIKKPVTGSIIKGTAQKPDFTIPIEATKSAYYSGALIISDVLEGATHALFRNPEGNKKYDLNKGVAENDLKTALLIEQKERQQSQAGAFALGTLGVFIPSSTIGISATTRAKLGVLAAEEKFGNFETKGIDAFELQLRGRYYQTPTINKANALGVIEGGSIKGGFQPESEGLGLIKPKEIQAQIYPKALPIEELRVNEIFRLTSTAGKPTAAEVENALSNQLKLTTDFRIIKETPPRIVTSEKVFKIFREDNPATKAIEIRDFLPAPKPTTPTKGLFEVPSENIEINNKLYEYNPNTKKLVLLGNKKGQSTSLIFDNSLEFNRRNPDLFINIPPEERLSIPPTELNAPRNNIYIPVAVSPFYPTGTKPITELSIKSFNFTNNKNSIISANIPKSDIFTGNKININSKNIIEQNFRSSSKSKQEQTPIIMQSQSQSQKQQQKQIQELIQVQETETITPNIYKITQKFKFDIQKPKEETPRPPLEFPKPKTPKIIGTTSGFNVLIKKAGIWTKTNPQPLSKGEAINYGAYTIERTPQASFRISPANKPATGHFKAPSSLTNFYTKGGTYIEKPSKRINTIGELAGITFKGLNIKRNKIKGWF